MQTIHRVLEWLEIRASSGSTLPASVSELREAIDHSALLPRLLSGKGPLPAAPPLSFGQPWYELDEQGFAECVVERDAGHLAINGSPWEILDGSGTSEFLVRQPGGRGVYLVWRLGPLSGGSGSSEARWMIERKAPAAAGSVNGTTTNRS